jgi:tripeptidyl-peptidase-1
VREFGANSLYRIPDAAAGNPPGNEPYLTWVNFVLSQQCPPQVISTSYADDEQTVPQDYAQRVCNSFAQLGARGHSLLFGSGDGGVGGMLFPQHLSLTQLLLTFEFTAIGGNNASLCVSNDGNNTFKFLPEFPSSCPYITTVGATQNFEPEVVAHRPANSLGPDGKLHGFYSSGGGFSEYVKLLYLFVKGKFH